MGQIVVDLLHLTAAVYLVSVILRVLSQVTKDRFPTVSHAIEFGIGK